jgi:hypothetical protein
VGGSNLHLPGLPYVENSHINLEKLADKVGFIRGDIEFQDGSHLYY